MNEEIRKEEIKKNEAPLSDGELEEVSGGTTLDVTRGFICPECGWVYIDRCLKCGYTPS